MKTRIDKAIWAVQTAIEFHLGDAALEGFMDGLGDAEKLLLDLGTAVNSCIEHVEDFEEESGDNEYNLGLSEQQ